MDFTSLTSEQLLNKFDELCTAFLDRDETVKAAFLDAMINQVHDMKETDTALRLKAQAEQLRIEKEILAARTKAAEDERKAKMADLWAFEKARAEELQALLGTDDLYLTVWNKSDKRIYLNTGKFFNGNKVATYFIEGNSYHRPGKFDFNESNYDLDLAANTDLGNLEIRLKEVFDKYAARFNNGKFEIAEALKYSAEPINTNG